MLSNEVLSRLFPVGAIALYEKSGVARVLRLSSQTEGKLTRARTKRGRVTELSQKSLNRLNFLVQTTRVEFKSILTLTYLCAPVSGRKAKKDLKLALQWLKRRCNNDLSYVWWAEFTGHYAIHFHILLSCVPIDGDIADFALYWLKITDQGYGRYCDLRKRREMDVVKSILKFNGNKEKGKCIWEKLRKVDGAKRYCAKYATKPYQKQVPEWFQDIGRFWGASRDVKKERQEPRIIQLSEAELRQILDDNKKKVGQWDVLPAHLWGVTEQMFVALD